MTAWLDRLFCRRGAADISAMLAAAVLVTAPSLASAQGMQTVDETAVTPGARSCLGLSSDFGAVRKRLVAEGWSRGKFQSADGKALRDPGKNIEVYGKDGLLLVLTTDPAKPGCVVTAKARPKLKFAPMLTAATAALGKAPFASQPGQAMWRLESGQSVMLRHRDGAAEGALMIVFTAVPAASPNQKKN